jgi:transcription initiation factor IIE alpha subunit
MKVIRNGKDKTYEITCATCNSDLEYTENDVFYTKEERRGGMGKTVSHFWKADEHYVNVYMQDYRCIRCPVCGNVIKMMDFSKGLPSLEAMKWEKRT